MTPKIGKKVVEVLKRRSETALAYAKQVMQSEKMEDATLQDALAHYLEHWNDFTHPGLFSMACEIVQCDLGDVIPPQAAIAMMAASFDIHDDIIDKSKIKHKILTVYGKFGEEIALLLGNAFLIEGFKLFIDSTATFSKEKQKEALETVKKLTYEVGKAHAIELGLKKTKNTEPDNYMKVIEMKAAGIELDMHMGALFGGGKDTDVRVLATLGRIIGTLVLLREEFIDIFEAEELSQRFLTNDFPIPLLFAMKDREAKRKIANIASKPKITQCDAAELINFTLESLLVVGLKDKMQSLIEQGITLTNNLPDSEARNQTRILLSFMLEDL